MKFKGQDFDIIAEGDNYVLQGLQQDIVLVGGYGEHLKEAEEAARKAGAAYIDEDGDIQFDYDGSSVTDYMNDTEEEFVIQWAEDESKEKIILDNNLN